MEDLWTLVHFESIDGRCPMVIFLDELPDEKFAALDSALTKVLALRGISLAGTKWSTIQSSPSGLEFVTVMCCYTYCNWAGRSKSHEQALRGLRSSTPTET